jgi:hypothetical protein
MKEECLSNLCAAADQAIFGQLILYVLLYNTANLLFPGFMVKWGGVDCGFYRNADA